MAKPPSTDPITQESTMENASKPLSSMGPDESKPITWEESQLNAQNWPTWKKCHKLALVSTYGLLASLGTSIISPAQRALITEFGVTDVQALLPLSLYVFALALGPAIAGPLSEIVGRQPIFRYTSVLGALFTVGAALTHNFGALCFLRFAAGCCWGPALAVASGTISETFSPKTRGSVVTVFVLTAFLGPGIGPVIGAFVVNRLGWRWTMWILAIFSAIPILLAATSQETYAPVLKRRLAVSQGQPVSPKPPFWPRLRAIMSICLMRPINMVFTEPIVSLVCLYVSVNFGILFSFFAAIPYTFGTVYHFNIEQSGLVFLFVAVGVLLGVVTATICDVTIHRPMLAREPSGRLAPEHRLYCAKIGSIGLPLGCFWFAWTAREDISWAVPASGILPFAWGTMCIVVSFSQYMVETYKGTVVASQASAGVLTRYIFAGAFPLFIVQMYRNLHISWALSFFGFVTVALMPLPWVFFKYGPRIRAKSKYDTFEYESDKEQIKK